MSFLKKFFGLFGNLGDRLVCVFFAFLFTQVPTYINQYTDVLAGAKMEAQKTYVELDESAAEFNLTVDAYLKKLVANEDAMVRENAEVSLNAVERYRRYQEAFEALTSASLWTRPFSLLKHYDKSIHAAMQFETNIPITVEGGVYAFVGVLIGLLAIALFTSIAKWIGRLINPPRPTYDPYKYRKENSGN